MPVSSLARVVQKAGEEQIGIGHAFGTQRRIDVEAVTPVGDVHRVEQGELSGCGPGHQRRTLLGRHGRPEVRPELADPTRPPGFHRRSSGSGR